MAVDQRRLLGIMQHEVARQCRFAWLAWEDVGKTVAELLRDAATPQTMDRLWYGIQNLLVATGDVSKLLWPSSQRSTRAVFPDRGPKLRASLKVGVNSPLEPRVFRNHWEHFDERLEQWAGGTMRNNFVDSNAGPLNRLKGFDAADVLRNFDPDSYVLQFRGDSYDLRALAKALKALWPIAETAWTQTLRPYVPGPPSPMR